MDDIAGSMEFHDSELLSVNARDGEVMLKAYVHRKINGQGEGGVQLVRLRFSELQVEGQIEPLPAEIYDSNLLSAGRLSYDLIPLPTTISHPVELTLVISGDARTVQLRGEQLDFAAIGDYEFVEFTSF